MKAVNQEDDQVAASDFRLFIIFLALKYTQLS